MGKEKDGGPAFPIDMNKIGYTEIKYPGMSLRDYFAAKAMQSLISEWPKIGGGTLTTISERSYQAADAMLEARGK